MESETPAATPVAPAAPTKSTDTGTAPDQKPLDKSLFSPFSTGDMKQINSVPNHKPPTQEDTIEGRYASVLFTTASQQESLFAIYEDISFIKEMYDNSETFRLFTMNGGIGKREMTKFNEGLMSIAEFNPLTIKFLVILAENKRLVYIHGISTRFLKLY